MLETDHGVRMRAQGIHIRAYVSLSLTSVGASTAGCGPSDGAAGFDPSESLCYRFRIRIGSLRGGFSVTEQSPLHLDRAFRGDFVSSLRAQD